MAEVFLRRGNYRQFLKDPQIILEGLERSGLSKDIRKDEFVGLKIHFGEKGNNSYINPALLPPLVNFLKRKEVKPFLFDTNTLYRGQRADALSHLNLARAHGFGKLNIPIIIGDGLKGNNYIEVEIEGKHFSTCFLASSLKDTDFLIVLSHFTGHMLMGFGAAVKNLGMGCASRKGKYLQHCNLNPVISEDKCLACGECAKNCPAQAINKKDKYFIEEKECIGCAQCITVCPVGAIKIIWSEEKEELGEKMVEYAYATARYRRCLYVNFCLYITKECDCMNKEKEGFSEDLGILYSEDPVSIDKASIDLILKREGRDILKEVYPDINYLHYLNYAQSIGLGSLDYEIVE